MITNDFQNGRTGFRPNKKEKGKEEDARSGDAEKGIPQHVLKRMANQKLSKESELREGKNEKKTEKGLTETMETGHALFAKEQNRGTNGSPGSSENSIIK